MKRAIEYVLPIVVFVIALWLLSSATANISRAYDAVCGEGRSCDSILMDLWLLNLGSVVAAFGLAVGTGWIIKNKTKTYRR